MLVVDRATERVLGSKSLTVAGGVLTPRKRRDLDSALGGLTYLALTAEAERARGRPIESLDVRDLSFRAVPGVTTIAAIRKWMHPGAELAGYEPLFDGLRLAGVPD